MEPTHDTRWEQAVAQMAQRFEYPATPDIAERPWQTTDHRPQTTAGGRPSSVVRRRATGVALPGRLAWVALVIAVLLVGALAVPQTRAALLSLFARIGAIDIFIDETAPTATPAADEGAIEGRPPVDQPASPPLTATSVELADHSMVLFAMGEAVTLEEARRSAEFTLVLPAALATPDEVYGHGNVDLPAVTLVWRDADGETLSLTEIGMAEFAMKMVGEQGVRLVQVGGRSAVWIEGPHLLQLLGNWESNSLLIESNVLIWADDEVTYRLEGDLSEGEMVAIAESLSP